MTRKYYDAEFAPDLLRALKKREILGRANLINYVPLNYNIGSFVEEIEKAFQEERRANPQLETTPTHAWLAAEIIPEIQHIRPNADVSEDLLSEALQRYFRATAKKAPLAATGDDTEEEKLNTTLEPYMDGLNKLLSDLMCRTKSLRGILSLPRNAFTIREATRRSKPNSKREAIILQGIEEGWPNPRIAKRLDEEPHVKPRSRDYKSYTEMLRYKPQLFYSLKNDIKSRYAGHATHSSGNAHGTSSRKAQG